MDMSLHVKKKWNWWRIQKRTELDKLLKVYILAIFGLVARYQKEMDFNHAIFLPSCYFYEKV